MELRILGRLEVIVDGEPVAVGQRRERALLALLLLDVNREVRTDRLIELLCDETTTRDPRKAIQVHVARLRRSLSTAIERGDLRLTSRSTGYTIHADPDAVDAHWFTSLVDLARRRTEPAERATLLRDALGLWRGPALADLSSAPYEHRVGVHLDEERVAAIELRVEAELAMGLHADLVGELADLTTRHPTRERLVASRMLALYRTGRKRDALQAYEDAAHQLAEEVGLDPGPELRELHVAILRDDPDLTTSRSTLGHAPIAVPPAQLPADLPTFTGRRTELADLLDLCGRQRTAVVIGAIDGMAGIGKSALAVHAAHRLKHAYPDGQLFVDLSGFTQGVEPVTPADALDRLLRSLGIPGSQLPAGVDDRAALYRSTLAEKKVLVLLDNAAGEAQVRPLLPGAASCLVLVTSRRTLAGLDQANPLSLDVLPLSDARALFTDVVGADRVAAEPRELLDHVVELCARLPLAVRIAAARLRTRPAWTLAHLFARLRDEHRRLGELDIGERSVAGAFRLSYRQLTADQQRLFRLLGLHPGRDVSTYSAAALADLQEPAAARLLDALLDAHLLQQGAPDRYCFHDLVRAFAAGRATEEDTGTARRDAVTRLLDWYLYVGNAAKGLLSPHSRRLSLDEPASATSLPPLATYDQALTWLDAEHRSLIATVHHAAAHGWHVHAWQLPHVLNTYLHLRGYTDDWITTQRLAVAAVDQLGDPRAEAEALNNLGTAYGYGEHLADAIVHLERALVLRRQLGDRSAEAQTLDTLGSVVSAAGRHDDALDRFSEALALRRRRGQCITLNNLGAAYYRAGRYADARDYMLRTLSLARELGSASREANTLTNLGHVYTRMGSHTQAIEHFQRGLALDNAAGNRPGEADARNGLGVANTRLGHHAKAREHYERALALSRQVGRRNLEVEALNGLGETCQATGDLAQALDHHRAALTVAEPLGGHYEQARAHHGIGRALLSSGDRADASTHLDRAHALYTELQAAEAEQVRTDMATLGGA